ncbi:hypothetical protein M422DRAFT_243466 [Sphaerobolus stellatus SS14]|nr:hypothetical protein M422DRAFT_243466 [Sphaerobolus stellatus SS14]
MQTPARQSALPPLSHLYAPPHARYPSQGGYRSHQYLPPPSTPDSSLPYSHELNQGVNFIVDEQGRRVSPRRNRFPEEGSSKKGRFVSLLQGLASAKRLGATCGKCGTPREVSRISRIFVPDRVGHQLSGFPWPSPRSLPCALARGDNDRDRIEKDY